MTKVTLYCPSTDATIQAYVISQFQTPEQVLSGIRLALRIPIAVLYTADVKHITNPHILQDGDRVLVATNESENVLPDAPREYVMYNGEEAGGEIPIEEFGEGFEFELWDDMDIHSKRAHILHLIELRPMTRNRLRITRSWEQVQKDFLTLYHKSVGNALLDVEDLTYSSWNVTAETFLTKPRCKVYPPERGRYLILAAIDVLSTMTIGQPRLAREIFDEAIALRTEVDVTPGPDQLIRLADVKTAIEMIYEKAGIIKSKGRKPNEPGSEVVSSKEKRKAAKEAKKEMCKERKFSWDGDNLIPVAVDSGKDTKRRSNE